MTIATIGMIEVALYRFFSLATDRTLEPSVPTILYTSHCGHGVLLAYNFNIADTRAECSYFFLRCLLADTACRVPTLAI